MKGWTYDCHDTVRILDSVRIPTLSYLLRVHIPVPISAPGVSTKGVP